MNWVQQPIELTEDSKVEKSVISGTKKEIYHLWVIFTNDEIYKYWKVLLKHNVYKYHRKENSSHTQVLNLGVKNSTENKVFCLTDKWSKFRISSIWTKNNIEIHVTSFLNHPTSVELYSYKFVI